MSCPACGSPTKDTDWICSFCDHILDPSVLDETSTGDLDEAREERTHVIAWDDHKHSQQMPEAVMLGDVSVAEQEFGVVHGAGSDGKGGTSTFLYYTSGSTTRVIHPDAIPRAARTDATIPRTPYEDFILSCIDGKRSVRDIQRASGLAPQEVVVTLLTLLDKGAVEIETSDGAAGSSDLDVPSPRAHSRRVTPMPTRPKSAGKPRRRSRMRELSDPTDTLPKNPVSRSRTSPPPLPEDFDDLPSVSDFEEIVDELEAAEAAPRMDSLSDVWAGTNDRVKVVEPTPLDEDAAEEVTKAVAILEKAPKKPRKEKKKEKAARAKSSKKGRKSSKRVTSASVPIASKRIPKKPPPIPDPSEIVPRTPLIDPAEVKRGPPPVPDPSEINPRQSTEEELEAALLAPTPPPLVIPADDPTPPPRPRAISVKPIPLDPSFLVEVPPSGTGPLPQGMPDVDDDEAPIVAPLGGASARKPSDAELKAQRKRALAAAVKRGPIQERVRGRDGRSGQHRSPDASPSGPSPVVSHDASPTAPPPAPERPERPEIDNARMVKAQKLFDQALVDKADGNLVSARMNMKLALTFDPTNELYQKAFEDLSKNPDAVLGGTPEGRSRARDLYDEATEAENHGNVDRAIELLEKALAESKQAPFYNRLGVILATKKGEYDRAQKLIEQALELAPGNALYEKNLSKVLSKAAAADVRADGRGGEKKGGLLGFLGRRK